MQAQSKLEASRTELEKVMLGLPPDRTHNERRMFLVGYIECLFIKGHISSDTATILSAEYGF